MPLQLKSKDSINAPGSEVYMEVVNATGVYDVDDNPGGFGTPNPTRNSLALLFYGVHALTSGNQEVDLLAYNPLTVTSFTVRLTPDRNGVIQYNVFALSIYDAMLSYDDGDVVYNNENPSDAYPQEMVDAVWVRRTIEELLDIDTVIQLNTYTFAIPNAIDLKNQLNAVSLQLARKVVYGQCGKDDYETMRASYDYVEMLLSSAVNAYCAVPKAYNEAQANIEEIRKYQTEKLIEYEQTYHFNG